MIAQVSGTVMRTRSFETKLGEKRGSVELFDGSDVVQVNVPVERLSEYKEGQPLTLKVWLRAFNSTISAVLVPSIKAA